MASEAPATAANYWGDMPEEEYYASQGVRNSKSYFDTPNGKLFTQTFLPLDPNVSPKATVFMTHGYGSDTGWLFQKICINYATWGYAVFAADLLGHGRSDGIRCYAGDLEKIAATSLCFFKSVRNSDEYKHLPAFLFGESMGGLATLLMYLQSEPDTWTGLIFSAPLFVIPEPMKPSKKQIEFVGTLTLGNGVSVTGLSLYPGNSSSSESSISYVDCQNDKELKKNAHKIVVCIDKNDSVSEDVYNVRNSKVSGAVFITNSCFMATTNTSYFSNYSDKDGGERLTGEVAGAIIQ